MLGTFFTSRGMAQMKVAMPNVVLVNAPITARIEGVTGAVGLESEITQSSTVVTVQNPGTISLGSIRKDGFVAVRLSHGAQQVTRILIAVTAADLAATTTTTSTSIPGLNLVLLKKFYDNINALRLKNAALAGLKKYVVENPVGVGANMTVCALIPVFPPAGKVCFFESVTNGVSLGLEILKVAADNMVTENILSAAEDKEVKTSLTLANLGFQLVMPGKLIEKSFTSVAAIAEIAVEHEGIKLTIKFTVDEYK